MKYTKTIRGCGGSFGNIALKATIYLDGRYIEHKIFDSILMSFNRNYEIAEKWAYNYIKEREVSI